MQIHEIHKELHTGVEIRKSLRAHIWVDLN